MDLLNNNEKIAGFVSYSPALQKAIFVPVVPFQPNGFYRVDIRTDEEQPDGTLVKGVHDRAGNPLDNAFSWTLHTTDTPFEETWRIVLRATQSSPGGPSHTDANNIAGVAFGALDEEDEQDARSVPKLTSQMGLSFLNRSKERFDRDIRPADGRLGHHWFFFINNPLGPVITPATRVQLFWQPSIKLRSTLRQYQVLHLIEFNT